MHYSINSDGTLKYKDYTRIGKNTDESRINMYNDHIFVSAIGGMQNYGEGNAETSITAATLTNGSVSKDTTKTINVPSSVKAKGQDFRDLKILPNGTAYVMCFNLGSAGGIDTTIYQTTVSNLYATNPKDWTVVHSGNYDGWFGKLNAEMYTHRLWVEAGQNLLVYTDGDTSPKYSWAAKDFGKSSMSQYNFMAMLQPDTVYGDEATLTAVKAEGLTNPSVSVTAVVNSDGVWKIDDEATYKYQITGTSIDNAGYSFDTDDYSTYAFDEDKVISVDKSKYLTGDLTTNVLAAVDAHSGNDVTIDAGSNTLQLQSSHTIGSPSGIYAGNKKNVTVTAGKLNLITAGMTGGNSLTNGIWLDAPANGASSITIHAPTTNIAMTGGYGGNGIAIQKTDRWGEASDAAAGTNKITLDGNLNIKGADSATWGIGLNPENVYSRFNNAGILTSVKNSEVEVKGLANMDVYGNGITVNAAGSKVSIGGGTIHVPSGRNYGYYTLGAYQGTINVNTGTAGTAPGTQKVQLNGDVFARSGAHVNMALTTSDSYLHGIVDNGGTVNMWLQNGATWTNKARNTRYAEDNEDVGSNGASHITKFVGGSTTANAGIINQKSDQAITIDNYSGHATVNYGTMTKNGAGVTISAAAPQSALTVSGDRAGLSDREAMETLAKKLTYTGYAEGERNLTGTVKVNEGLTTRSVARTGTISFDAATGEGGLGHITQTSPAFRTMARSYAMPVMLAVNNDNGSTTFKDDSGNTYTIGSRETSMMQGTKAAMTTSMLAWRSSMTDMMQRMGDIRMGASDGIWARTYGGKAKYDKDHAYTSNSFWGAQVGADHALASGWHIGAAFDYNDGDASYRYGGSGDPKQYLGSLYGTKTFEDGQYLDIVGKFGHTQNDYSVYNADGKKLDGKYSANGYGLSLEYGKCFGSSHGYVEPQIQLSYSKLGSDDYTGSSNFAGNEKMFIHQDGMDSFIGRLGIAAGKTTDRSSYYLKASVLHEFDGDTSATYTSESNGTPITIKQDFGDTWAELALGGTWKIGGSSLFYADITRSFGGDYEMQWKLNAGIRYAF
uniref:autotransporter outer membrane beta-barrel domain-containing protein n=1 Tax=Dialister sp. TaxID=1955814 RepID=UPI00402626FC